MEYLLIIIYVLLASVKDAYIYRVKFDDKDQKILHSLGFITRSLIVAIITKIYGFSLIDFLINGSIFFLLFDYSFNIVGRILFKRYDIKWWSLGSNWFDQILKGYNMRYYRLGVKVFIVLALFLISWMI